MKKSVRLLLCLLLFACLIGSSSNAQTGSTTRPTTATAATSAGCSTNPVMNVLNSIGQDLGAAPVLNQAINDWFKAGQLEKYKFQLGGADGSILYDATDPANPVAMGKVIQVNVPFTYEWAETPTHLAWLREHGISGYEMKQDILAPGQAAGKGYYVSSNPIDSIMYGDGLTVFRPGRPMIILKEEAGTFTTVNGAPTYSTPDQFATVTNDTKTVLRLRSAGVDGFQNSGTNTWFSIINDSLLKGTSEVDAEYLRDYIKQNTPADVLNTVLTLETRPWEGKLLSKYFPKDHPLAKLIRQETLTPAEATAYSQAILALPRPPSFSSKEKFFGYLREKVFAPFLTSQLAANDAAGFSNVINFLSKAGIDYRASADILSHVHAKLSPGQKIYQQIVTATDLYDIAAINPNGGAITPETLAALKTSAGQYAIAQDAIKKIKNPSLNEMMAAVQKGSGQPLQFRASDASLGTPQANGTSVVNVNWQTYYTLNSNHLLSVSSTSGDVIPWGSQGTYSATVNYPSVKNYQSFSNLLSATLLDQLNTMGGAPTADVIAKMNSAISQELVAGLFDPVKRLDTLGIMQGYTPVQIQTYRQYIQPTPSALYQAFLSIHPFESGNETMAKLFFQYSNQDLTNPAAIAYQKAVTASMPAYQAATAEAQKNLAIALQNAQKLATVAEQAVATAQANAAAAAAEQAAYMAYNATINAEVLQAMSETVPAAGKIGDKVGYPMNVPASNFGLLDGNDITNYLRLQPAISHWLSQASSDQDFLTRAQTALSLVETANPNMTLAIPPLPASP